MRRILAAGIALMFALPATLAADAELPANETDPVEIVEVTTAEEVERVDLRLGDAQVESAEVIEDLEEAAVTQPPDRQWWWLVGAIVIAGIILAVIL